MKPCIVYLAQNSINENRRGSRSLLIKSLHLLFKNYNGEFKHDVIIFHEGDFTEQDQLEIIAGRKEITFREIHFQLPSFLSKEDIPIIWTDGKNGGLSQYGIGYRHMIRFYAIQVYDILRNLGYDWMIRLDDDSFIHSKIDYNLFQFMVDHKFRYGYRVKMLEPIQPAKGFENAVIDYTKENHIDTKFRDCQKIAIREQLKLKLESLIMFSLEKTGIFPKKYFIAPFNSLNHWYYYNNFFITDLTFWTDDRIRSFLVHIDQLAGIYKYRWGDLLIQSTAVQLFMQESQIHQFDDWVYEHATIKNDQLMWGGIYSAKGKSKLETEYLFREKYGRYNTPIFWSKY